MKLIGYINELKENSFAIPVYSNLIGKYYYHKLDNDFNIEGFSETNLNTRFYTELNSSNLFNIGDKGAIVFVCENNYVLYNFADLIVDDIIYYIENDAVNECKNITLEIFRLKDLLIKEKSKLEKENIKNKKISDKTFNVFSNNEFENFSFDLPKNKSNVCKVIGVGGGGSNAINNMFKQGINGVDFIVCNTDYQALQNSPVPNKIQLGVSLTEGLGARSNPDIGVQSAIESITEIEKILDSNTKMIFIVAGMGGGTGTGATSVIAQLAKERDILTIGIVSIPFQFEGKVRMDNAQLGIEKLKEQIDSIIIINNNKLREVYGNLGFKDGFSKADEVLANACRGITEVITHHYTQNIDLKDAKTILSNSGTAIMGSATASGENRAKEAIVLALDSPLLNDNKISGAKNVLLLIVSGSNEITIDEIGDINDHIQTEAGFNANIIMGIGEDDSLNDSISIIIIATGFNLDQQESIINIEKKKVIYSLDENKHKLLTRESLINKDKIILDLTKIKKGTLINKYIEFDPITELHQSGVIKYSLEEYMEMENELLLKEPKFDNQSYIEKFPKKDLLNVMIETLKFNLLKELEFNSINENVIHYCFNDFINNEFVNSRTKFFNRSFLNQFSQNINKNVSSNSNFINLTIEEIEKFKNDVKRKKLKEFNYELKNKSVKFEENILKNINFIKTYKATSDEKIQNKIINSKRIKIINCANNIEASCKDIEIYLGKLNEKELDVISLYYGFDYYTMTLEDISKFFNESLTSIRKIKNNAIRKWKFDKENKILKYLNKNSLEIENLGYKLNQNDYELIRKVKLEDLKSIKKLLKKYSFLIALIIKKHQNNDSSISELISYGNLGLISAAQYFNENNDHEFHSYAIWWIRKMILDSTVKLANQTESSKKVHIDKTEPIYLGPYDNNDVTLVEMSIEETLKLRADERRKKLKEFNYKFQNNPSHIDELEREPAYKRLGIDLTENPLLSNISRMSLGTDSNDDLQLRSNNSFLHDNVD